MSMDALLQGFRNALRARLGDSRGQVVQVSDDGRPPPTCGQVFYGIVGGEVQNNSDQDDQLDESYSLSVLITLRASYTPEDRFATELLVRDRIPTTPGPPQPSATNATNRNKGGIWRRAEDLRVWGHGNWTDIMTAANEAAGGDAVQGFCEAMKFRKITFLGTKDYAWFGCEPDDESPAAGVAIRVDFDKARRIQEISTAT